MTLEVLYRRSLVVVALLALSLAALSVAVAAGWSAQGLGGATPVGVLIASGALAAGALAARRGRMWRPIVVLAIGSGFCAAAAMALVPWWAAVPAGLAVLAFALLVPSMIRRDRLAAALATALAAAFGVQAAWALDAVAHRPGATLERFEAPAVAAPEPTGSEAYLRGRRDAQRDLAAGRWRLLTYGYPASSRVHYREALGRDGIELEAVAGCVVTTELMEHVRGYNQVMEIAIAKLLGPGYLERQWQAADDAVARSF